MKNTRLLSEQYKNGQSFPKIISVSDPKLPKPNQDYSKKSEIKSLVSFFFFLS